MIILLDGTIASVVCSEFQKFITAVIIEKIKPAFLLGPFIVLCERWWLKNAKRISNRIADVFEFLFRLFALALCGSLIVFFFLFLLEGRGYRIQITPLLSEGPGSSLVRLPQPPKLIDL